MITGLRDPVQNFFWYFSHLPPGGLCFVVSRRRPWFSRPLEAGGAGPCATGRQLMGVKSLFLVHSFFSLLVLGQLARCPDQARDVESLGDGTGCLLE